MPRAAVLEMNSGKDPGENLRFLSEQLDALSGRGVDMVLTPENTLALGGPKTYRKVAEPLGDGPLQTEASRLAREHGVWLSLGSFPTRLEDDSLRATTLVYDAGGELRAHYEKLHLFDVDVEGDRDGKAFSYRESDAYGVGEREVVVDTPLGELGLTICYDLRFPGLYTRLRELGARVLAIPAAFTRVTGEAHWETLLRARAIETQCFVLAPAQGGLHADGRETWGHSMAIDPWGRVLGTASADEPWLVVDLDLEEVERVRRRMPMEEHARFTSRR